MSTRKAAKGVGKQLRVLLRANRGIQQRPANANVLTIAPYNVGADVRQLRVTDGEKMRPWLAEDVFQALGDEKAKGYGQC